MPVCRRCGIEFSPYPANRPGLECWRCEHASREDEAAAVLQAARERISARHRAIKVGERDKAFGTPQAAGRKLHHVFWASQYGLQVSAKYLELQAFGLQDFGLQGYKAGPPGCQVAGLQVAGQGYSLAVGCGLQAGDCKAVFSFPPRWAR